MDVTQDGASIGAISVGDGARRDLHVHDRRRHRQADLCGASAWRSWPRLPADATAADIALTLAATDCGVGRVRQALRQRPVAARVRGIRRFNHLRRRWATGHTVTASGNAQIDTAQFKFGASSGLFDGNGDFLTTPDHADWVLGDLPFTIEGFVRFAGLNTGERGCCLLAQYASSGNQRSWDSTTTTTAAVTAWRSSGARTA